MKALEITNLSKVYAGGVHALKGISLSVEAGDFFALLGPNGAGKSTTIGIIATLVTKSGGAVKVFGHDMDTELDLAKASIGLVPQEINFSQFETVLEIVVNQAGYYGLPAATALARAEHYLKQLDLWERRFERSRNLSGGMKRRLMIARALLHEPRLLILDEPTAGVDIELRRSMWDFLCRINAAGTTIILTTHYLEEAESLCRNIAIIDDGMIVENTRMKELLNRLHVETFVLDIDKPLQASPPGIGFDARLVDPHTLEVNVDRARNEDLNQVFAALGTADIRVTSMRSKSNRLEELFLRLTDDSAPPAAAPLPGAVTGA
ncbi:MAG: ABC transporter ATP-binding protein [Gammaproteobacteria bacterium]|nr:ABC transporter ATP-binding protein [Gammaproteobacteria bacterium]